MGKLLEKARMGGMELRNRVVFLPMATHLAHKDGTVSQPLIDYYARRARGGAGLIVVEASAIDPHQFFAPTQVRVSDDKYIPGLASLARAVKAHGARIAAQVHHPGRQCRSAVTGLQPVAPSPIPCPVIGEMPRELSLGEIETIVEEFAQGARRLQEAGFDAVELHGAHGYLLCQFLSPFSNRRQDSYGGDLSGRSRLALEAVAHTREAVGPRFPVIFRFSADEHVPGGLTLNETRVFARRLEEAGVDALSISAGNYAAPEWMVQPMLLPRGCLLPLAGEIRRAVNIPIIAAGRLNDVKLAEKALEEGKADFIGMGRPLLADPDLPEKALQGRERQTIRCMACNCCQDEVIRMAPIACLMNPEAGREGQVEARAERSQRVMVIGGGPAGLEAARVAALRGHQVSLWDESPRLGGRWSWLIRPYVHQQETALVSLGVELRLGESPLPQEIREQRPDAVVVTSGGRPQVPNIEGIGLARVLHADAVLGGKAQAGGEVVILGGGNIGCETAEFLRRQGTLATIVESGGRIGSGLEREIRNMVVANLRRHRVRVLASTEVVRVDRQGLTVRDSQGKEDYLRADCLILALGHEPGPTVAESLRAGGDFELYEVGYCERPRHAFSAAQQGAAVARRI